MYTIDKRIDQLNNWYLFATRFEYNLSTSTHLSDQQWGPQVLPVHSSTTRTDTVDDQTGIFLQQIWVQFTNLNSPFRPTMGSVSPACAQLHNTDRHRARSNWYLFTTDLSAIYQLILTFQTNDGIRKSRLCTAPQHGQTPCTIILLLLHQSQILYGM